jgi:soluble lytic murein transglycosylase-like protein
MALAAGLATAGDRTAGVVIFTAPNGTRQVVNVPAPTALLARSGSVPALTSERRLQLWPTVQDAARTHGLDPALVDLVIRMESGYNTRAVSAKGARGVMQLMPATASLYGVEDIFDPFDNIRAGVRYLRDLLRRFNSDLSLALAAYNAGPEAVVRHGGVPPYEETRNYVRAILSSYKGGGLRPLTGGFGRPTRPVELTADAGRSVLSNGRRTGEATVQTKLQLR